MTVWPKSFYTFGVDLRTAATEWKLRHKRTAPAAQAAGLQGLLPRLAAARHWRSLGVEAGLDYGRFRERVPLQTHAQLAPLIDRMRRGEADVLWPGTCSLFALSSGVSTGQPRHFPVTEEMLRHFRRGQMESLLYYNVRVRHAGVFRGRHLVVGGSMPLTRSGDENGHPSFSGDLSAILEVNLPRWAEQHLYEPGGEIAAIPDWDARLEAILARTRGRDITLIAGLPSWVLTLAKKIIQRTRSGGRNILHLQALWPNLECLLHTGVPAAPFARELRTVLGPEIRFHEVYAAAEGFFATQDSSTSTDGLRLMADVGLFFEFLPLTEYDERRLDQLGGKAVPLEDVRPGVDYVLLVTTPGGLVRTLVGDIVRFTGVHPPRLVYVGRTPFLLNAFEERVTEKEVTDSLAAVCGRYNWQVVNFHVAPHFERIGFIGHGRGNHEWWIELKPGTVLTPTGPQIAEEVDADLQRVNPAYAARRCDGTLTAPLVRLVMPGVFEHWLRFARRWGGMHRMPRCRNDREIAHQLADITNFARD